jgi:stage III sporulation protein AD
VEIARIAAVGIIGAALAVILRKDNPTFAMFVGVATGIAVFALTIPAIETALGILTDLENRASAAFAYAPQLLKIVGICYIAEFGAQALRDAGESNIASRVEFGGKMLILAIAAPIVAGLMDDLLSLIGGI